jgi:hypothetical protein
VSTSDYRPFTPARRPGGRPEVAPGYRILVHRKFQSHWQQLVGRVGLQQAQQFWDHVAHTPGAPSPVASITILRGAAGGPIGPGWSRTHHYEVSGAGRINYQFHNEYVVRLGRDAHPVVAIRTIDFSSH